MEDPLGDEGPRLRANYAIGSDRVTVMAYEDRKKIHHEIEELRGGRLLVCFFNFDRASEPILPGFNTQFAADSKEALYRILKESDTQRGLDLCLYTRGGDTNSVWPIVSLMREFDSDFQVLVPFRCHSSGTLVALGAKKILMGPLSELSPIDPTTGNQFNPADPADQKSRMGISVEDVRAYQSFVLEQFRDPNGGDQRHFNEIAREHLQPFVEKLAEQVHPLALGNVQRVLMQIKQLASNLLDLNARSGEKPEGIVEALTTHFYSHLHMINRHEAQDILGERVEFASAELSDAMDRLLRSFEDSFGLRRTFFLVEKLQGAMETDLRIIGGALESKARSYLFETKANIRQHVRLPPNVQLQIPAGQPMPDVPGLPKETQVEITARGWVHNKKPLGVTS